MVESDIVEIDCLVLAEGGEISEALFMDDVDVLEPHEHLFEVQGQLDCLLVEVLLPGFELLLEVCLLVGDLSVHFYNLFLRDLKEFVRIEVPELVQEELFIFIPRSVELGHLALGKLHNPPFGLRAAWFVMSQALQSVSAPLSLDFLLTVEIETEALSLPIPPATKEGLMISSLLEA